MNTVKTLPAGLFETKEDGHCSDMTLIKPISKLVLELIEFSLNMFLCCQCAQQNLEDLLNSKLQITVQQEKINKNHLVFPIIIRGCEQTW